MKRLLLILVLLLGLVLPSWGATGDITGAAVEANGWVLSVYVDGYSTNSRFTSLTNHTKSAQPVVLTVWSPGFDSTGATNYTARPIYGTRQLRLPYPYSNSTSNLNDVTVSGTGVKIRVALSDYVFGADGPVSVQIASGWYSNNAAAAFTLTNNSTVPYPKVIGKWTCVPYQLVQGSTYRLSFTAAHISAGHGKPVAAYQFIAQDAHGHAVTNTVSQMTVDSSQGDWSPIVEAVADMSTAALTSGDVITNNVVVFPRRGTNYLWTGDGAWGEFSAQYSPLYHKLDTSHTYGPTWAIVSTNGTATGVATTNLDFSNPPAAFASINQAATAICGTNLAKFGHNDCGGGVIILTNGDYSFTGTAGSVVTTFTPTWIVLTNWPGTTPRIKDGTGNGNLNGRIALKNLIISAQEAFTFSAVTNLWFDHCTWNVTNSTSDLIDGTGVHYLTQNIITNLDQGIRHQGSQNTVFRLVRGNWLMNVPQLQPYCLVGNLKTGTNQVATFLSTGLTGLPQKPELCVVAFNRFYQANFNGVAYASFYLAEHCTNGTLIAQNLIEGIATNNADVMFGIHSDGAVTGITNVLVFENTLVGKCNVWYNDQGTAAANSWLCSERGNILTDGNTKHDTFGAGTQNANRVGGWPLLFGVGVSHNAWTETAISHSPGEFLREWAGMNSYQPVAIDPATFYGQPPGSAGYANVFNWEQFQTNLSWDGVAGSAAGLGTYRLLSSSPMVQVPGENIYPYDIEGNYRGVSDPPGAFSAGNPRKGGGFF